MAKTGRNDPCWCGSGTKYKKCHLSSDEAEARKDRDLQKEAEALRDPMAEKLAGEILEGTERWHTREDFERASEIYHDADPREVAHDPDQEDGFLEWYMRDFRPAASGRTAVEMYLEEAGSRLLPREREMVEAWRDGKFCALEVESFDFGVGVRVRDLQDGAEYAVADPLISKQVKQWDCLLSRMDFFEGKWMLSGDTISVPRVVVRHMLNTLEGSKDLRAHSHELHRTVENLIIDWVGDEEVAEMDDDLGDVVITELVCSDEAAARTEFRKVPQLVEVGPGFAWRGSDRNMLGTLGFNDGRLRLNCQSTTRLEIFQELVEHLAGPYLSKPEV